MTDETTLQLQPLSSIATVARFVIHHEKAGLCHVADGVITSEEFELGAKLSREALRSLMLYMKQHGIVFAIERP